jgi:hypothetical protein
MPWNTSEGRSRRVRAVSHPLKMTQSGAVTSKRPAYGGSPGRPCVSLRESFFAHRFHEFKPAILNGKHAADVPLGKPTERRGRYRWGCDNQPLFSKTHFVSALLKDPLGKWTDDFRAAEPRTEMGRTLLDQLRRNGSLWRIGARLRTGIFCELEGFTGDDVWENAGVIELPTTAADRATAKSFLRTQCPVETEDRCESNHRSIGRADVKAPADCRRARLGSAASLFNATTEVRDRFWMKRYGPSRRRA